MPYLPLVSSVFKDGVLQGEEEEGRLEMRVRGVVEGEAEEVKGGGGGGGDRCAGWAAAGDHHPKR